MNVCVLEEGIGGKSMNRRKGWAESEGIADGEME
jgi:hypothetical protein